MLEYNSAGSFDLVNLFIVQQEYEMQRKKLWLCAHSVPLTSASDYLKRKKKRRKENKQQNKSADDVT